MSSKKAMSCTLDSTSNINTFWLGVRWKILSATCFAFGNGLVHYLSGGAKQLPIAGLPTGVIFFYQCLFGLLFAIPWFIKSQHPLLDTQHHRLHLLRVVGIGLGTSFWFLALKYATALQVVLLGSFAGIVLSVLGAIFILKEQASRERILAVGLCLLATYLFYQHKRETLSDTLVATWTLLLPMIAMIIWSGTKLITRKLGMLEQAPDRLTFYYFIFIVPIAGLFALNHWQQPGIVHWPWLIALGLLSVVAHYAMNTALSYLEVTVLTPFGTLKYVLNGLIGYMIFLEHDQTLEILVGMVVVFICTLLLKTPSKRHANNTENDQTGSTALR